MAWPVSPLEVTMAQPPWRTRPLERNGQRDDRGVRRLTNVSSTVPAVLVSTDD